MKAQKIKTTELYMDSKENWRQPINTTQKFLVFGTVSYYDEESIKGNHPPKTCSVLEFLLWAKTTVSKKVEKIKKNTDRMLSRKK